MQAFDYFTPQTIQELCQCLKTPGARIVAGGTDVLPQMHAGRLQPQALVDISRLSELRYICLVANRIEIGALTTFTDLQRSELLRQEIPALYQSAASIGAPMTRNRATIGGNIGNASPAGDSIPALLIHDTYVSLVSQAGERILPLLSFFQGPGKTTLEAGEFIHHISVGLLPAGWGSAFQKIGPRRGMTIAITSAAAALGLDASGKITGARIAAGAVAPTVVRCPQTEAMLANQLPNAGLWQSAAELVANEIAPIDDVRSTRAYRLRASVVLISRALQDASEFAQRRMA